MKLDGLEKVDGLAKMDGLGSRAPWIVQVILKDRLFFAIMTLYFLISGLSILAILTVQFDP